jgi:hypothetical protein
MTARTYYDQPILKEPAWTVEVPWYFFAGGLAGASSIVSSVADLRGDDGVARIAGRVAAAGALASPVLLVLDLGRPARFIYMLRLVKPTSPLSVGSWVLAGYVPAALTRAVIDLVGAPTLLRRPASLAAAAGGAVMSVYTAVLVANTAIPVWHEARRELPFLFAASSAASAGAAVLLVGGAGRASPAARRLTVAASVVEIVVERLMHRRLGPLADPYRDGPSGTWAKLATALTVVGAVVVAAGRRRRIVERVGAATVLLGSLCQRFAVFRAGFASARDARATVAAQRSDPAHR